MQTSGTIPCVPGFFDRLVQAAPVKGTEGIPVSLPMNRIGFFIHLSIPLSTHE